MDFADDTAITNDVPFDASPGMSVIAGDKDNEEQTPERQKALVSDIIAKIKEDKKHHEKAFKRMRRDMRVAMWGAEGTWHEDNYRANIVGRHIKMKTAALYAKNPKATAKKRETMDFVLWDESPASLQLAFQTMQQATAVMAQSAAMNEMIPPQVDPASGMPIPPPEPQLPPGAEEAQALIADFQAGIERRQMLTKFGKTLEIVFAHQLKEQKPLDFKRGMKAMVRRANTTGVGYVELGFQRENGPRPGMTEKLADFRARLDHLRNLAEQAAEGEITDVDAEMAELEASMASLEAEPEIVIREGLIIDYPASTKVIPDKMTKALDGFVGARHLTIEYTYTVSEIQELFGVDLTDRYTAYTMNKGSQREYAANDVMDDDYEWSPPEKKKDSLVCVWKHYDKVSGLVYFVADGYHTFLREPAAPDVFVEGFWPVYALTFNQVESEDELFPPSDVTLLLDMQREYNRSRQGKREHRQAARPRWVFPNGALGDEEDPMRLKNMKPFEALGLDMDPAAKISDIFQAFPVPGVDPNLYDTGEIFTDMQLVGGAQEANYGGVSKSTATESAIAANATNSSDGSAIDDLDSFLTTLSRDAGQILKREMSEEQVKRIAGPGAVWPQMTMAELIEEVDLEVEAGSTGKPNQAIEISNMQKLLPMILQIPNIEPTWLAREVLRRMDDRLDLTEALVSGIPSIAAQNMNRQTTGAPPQDDPNAQGGRGANNAPKPQREGGSEPAFGSNQTEPAPNAMM